MAKSINIFVRGEKNSPFIISNSRLSRDTKLWLYFVSVIRVLRVLACCHQIFI